MIPIKLKSEVKCLLEQWGSSMGAKSTVKQQQFAHSEGLTLVFHQRGEAGSPSWIPAHKSETHRMVSERKLFGVLSNSHRKSTQLCTAQQEEG